MPFISVADGRSAYSVLDGEYALGEEVGSGGFGKVKLATHLLTGDKVAVKIIDKKAIGADLPRVTTELRALRNLWHQNICRLYQFVETETKFFIVLEFCSGGELFDYIVKKECLPEPEARHFFRQIVSAIAYVHDKGFAHRDLKPENLLLTDELQMKLIDFGLCANPETGLSDQLETCCGSPAYAAPELIKGQRYFGNEADVWSMGILLYALLCGCLPFEDENIQSLYSKITAGVYAEPTWLSEASKALLREMLQTDPRRRISMERLLKHTWVQGNYAQPLKWRSVYDPNNIDEDCVRELAVHYHSSVDAMRERVKKWEYDYVTATYFLCCNRKKRGLPVLLPPARKPPAAMKSDAFTSNVLTSPTIHGSLETNLDKSGLTGDDDMDLEQDEFFQTSYAHAMAGDGEMLIDLDVALSTRNDAAKVPPPTVGDMLPPPMAAAATPRTSRYIAAGKENRPPALDAKLTTVYTNKAAIHTPVRTAVRVSPSQKWATETPMSKALRGVDVASRDASSQCSTPPTGSTEHTARSAQRGSPKTPKDRSVGRRMFASVERAKERVITLLTPRRGMPAHRDSPMTLKRTNTTVNVSTTSTNDPDRVLDELLRAFERRGIQCEVNGWKISGRARQLGRSLQFDLEVVYVEHLCVVGVRRKRLQGDAFLYKRVCEDILNLASL